MGVERKIPTSRANGHINLYTAITLRNLLETSGLTVTRLDVHDTTLAYEQSPSSRRGGQASHPGSFGSGFGLALAQSRFTYLATALCDCA